VRLRKALVVNLQRFSLHDGPGVRTTVFFKGCPLKCLWCHNPESQSFKPEIMLYPDRCAHCGRCAAVCPTNGKCDGCGACAEVCAFEARELVGKAYTAEEIFRLALRDQGLYDQTGGGVTLSGGEVMAQDAGFLRELLLLFKSRGVSVAIDTCGYAPWENFETILDLTDLFLYDLKALDPGLHRKLTGADNALILQNLEKLAATGAALNLRVPVVPGANADEAEMTALAEYALKACGPVPVNLLPYHRVGSDKAERLQRVQARFEAPTEEHMNRIQEIWRGAGFDRVEIGG
jgi:pyruvate formate lyase activating enzyme